MFRFSPLLMVFLGWILVYVIANENQPLSGLGFKSRRLSQSSSRVSLYYTFGLPNANCSSTDTEELDIRFLMSQWNVAFGCRRCSTLYELQSCTPYPKLKYQMYNRGIDVEHIQKALNTFVLNPVCILQFFSQYGIVKADILSPLNEALQLPPENVRFEKYDPELYPLLPNCEIPSGSIPAQVNSSRVIFDDQGDSSDKLITASAEFNEQGDAIIIPFAELVQDYQQEIPATEPETLIGRENLDDTQPSQTQYAPSQENDSINIPSEQTQQQSQDLSSQAMQAPSEEFNSSLASDGFPILQGSRQYYNDNVYSPIQESQFENEYTDFPVLQGSRVFYPVSPVLEGVEDGSLESDFPVQQEPQQQFSGDVSSPTPEQLSDDSTYSDFPVLLGSRQYFPDDVSSPIPEQLSEDSSYSDFPVLQGSREFFPQENSPVQEELQEISPVLEGSKQLDQIAENGNTLSDNGSQINAFAARTPTNFSNFPVLQGSLLQPQENDRNGQENIGQLNWVAPIPEVEGEQLGTSEEKEEDPFLIYTRCFKDNLSEQDVQHCANLTDQVMEDINERQEEDSKIENVGASTQEQFKRVPLYDNSFDSASEVRLESANIQNPDDELASSSTTNGNENDRDTKDSLNWLWIAFVSMVGFAIIIFIIVAARRVSNKKQ